MRRWIRKSTPSLAILIRRAFGCRNSGGGKTKWITVNNSKTGSLALGNDPDVLIRAFGWVRKGLLWAIGAQRVQDRLDLYFVDVESGNSQLIMTESTDAWIDMHREVDSIC